MRRLVWIAVICAALWCAWWAGASFWLNRATTAWFDDRRAEGWQAEVQDVRASGFPGQLVTELVAPQLADPDTGLAVEMESLRLSARAAWPGDVMVALPETPVRIATPQGRWSLLALDGRAELNLHPGAALELENMSATSQAFRVETANGDVIVSADALTLALRQSDVPESYGLTFNINGLTPGQSPRAALLLPQDWTRAFSTLRADATITFDAPIDRRTLEDRRPQPTSIDLDRAEAQWGDMRFLATGSVIADPDGFAEGTMTIKAENWQKMLDLAQAAGLFPPEVRPQIEAILSTLASGTGRTNDVDVTLRMENGTTWLGFIPLGSAPSLRLR